MSEIKIAVLAGPPDSGAREERTVTTGTKAWELFTDDTDVVAARVGYSSASAFGAAFRRTTGLTPGRFRELGVSEALHRAS